MTSNVILKVNQLTRQTRQGEILLEPVSFEVNRGERIALTGGSGSGKTVLLRALAMLEPIQGGEIFWKGDKVSHSRIPAFRRDVHYLHQTPVLVDGTVRDNLLLPREFQPDDSEEKSKSENELEQLVQLAKKESSFLDRRTDVLSGGEKQIVALLRSFLVGPSLLLLDEPTAALDEDSKRNIETLIQNWMDEEGHAYIWVSHDGEQQDRISTREIRLENGRMISS